MVKSRKGGKTRRHGGNRKRKSRRGGNSGFGAMHEVATQPKASTMKLMLANARKAANKLTHHYGPNYGRGGGRKKRGGGFFDSSSTDGPGGHQDGVGGLPASKSTHAKMIAAAKAAAERMRRAAATAHRGGRKSRRGGRKTRRGGRKSRRGGRTRRRR